MQGGTAAGEEGLPGSHFRLLAFSREGDAKFPLQVACLLCLWPRVPAGGALKVYNCSQAFGCEGCKQSYLPSCGDLQLLSNAQSWQQMQPTACMRCWLHFRSSKLPKGLRLRLQYRSPVSSRQGMLPSCMCLPHQNAAPPLELTSLSCCRCLSRLSVPPAALPCSQPCLPRLLKGFPTGTSCR